MSTVEVETVRFCHVHGYAHPDGEMESMDSIPPEFLIGDDAIGESPVEPCHEDEWVDVCVLGNDEFEVINDETEAVLSQNFYTLRAGNLAYIYTVRGGLVPCKVVSVQPDRTTVQITADRTGWKRGETEVIRNPQVSLLHRDQVHWRNGLARVVGAVAVVTDDGRLLR